MEIAIIIGLILLNGILSMSEIALVSARKSKLETETKKGNKSAATALRLASNPDKFFSTIQIGITLIGILTGLYSGQAFAADLAEVFKGFPALTPYAYGISKTLIVIAVTYLTLVFGELLPKRLGMLNAEGISKSVSKPMIFLSRLTYPFVWLLSVSTSGLIRLFGMNRIEDSKVTEEEIKAIVKEGLDDGEVQKVEHDIVERVFNLGDRDVSSIMTHRNDLVFLNIDDTREELLAKILEDMHDNYPVVSGSAGKVLGVVSLKDLFRKIDTEGFSLKDIINPPNYLHEHKSAYGALMQFKETQVKYGLILDEYGTIQGIVTLKDIMEALVGEFYEPDEEKEIIRRNDGTWLVDGQYSFYDFLANFDMEELFPENDHNTVSGLILEILERIPVEGEKIEWECFGFEILDMDGPRIDKVLVTFLPEEPISVTE